VSGCIPVFPFAFFLGFRWPGRGGTSPPPVSALTLFPLEPSPVTLLCLVGMDSSSHPTFLGGQIFGGSECPYRHQEAPIYFPPPLFVVDLTSLPSTLMTTLRTPLSPPADVKPTKRSTLFHAASLPSFRFPFWVLPPFQLPLLPLRPLCVIFPYPREAPTLYPPFRASHRNPYLRRSLHLDPHLRQLAPFQRALVGRINRLFTLDVHHVTHYPHSI